MKWLLVAELGQERSLAEPGCEPAIGCLRVFTQLSRKSGQPRLQSLKRTVQWAIVSGPVHP
jgi:hypothetical protein